MKTLLSSLVFAFLDSTCRNVRLKGSYITIGVGGARWSKLRIKNSDQNNVDRFEWRHQPGTPSEIRIWNDLFFIKSSKHALNNADHTNKKCCHIEWRKNFKRFIFEFLSYVLKVQNARYIILPAPIKIAVSFNAVIPNGGPFPLP